MDNRTTIINDTLAKLQTTLTDEQIAYVRDVLYMELNEYEVEKRCTDIVPAESTSQGMLKKFLATKRLEGKSESTLDQYNLRCTNMLNTINKMVEDITTYDLRFYLASYKEIRKVSNRTLSNIQNCICSFFGWLYQEDFIPKNPASGLGQIKCEKQILQPFSDTEMEKIRNACSNVRDRAIVEFLYATGCRVSEVVALNRNDVDFLRKSVIVTGKGDKQRTVYLDDVALMYLTEYLESREDKDPCLFRCFNQSHTQDHRLGKYCIEYLITTLGKRADVEDAHPHRFRRTLATNLIARGASMQDVSTILGHSDLSTTQVYCTIDNQDVAHTYHRCIA